jgi:hypothetical protein
MMSDDDVDLVVLGTGGALRRHGGTVAWWHKRWPSKATVPQSSKPASWVAPVRCDTRALRHLCAARM